MFVKHMARELWVLIYDALQIKFTVIISLLERPSSLSTWRRTGKMLYLD